ncbi:MAG: XdhC family protein [Granulosicoccus sp.]
MNLNTDINDTVHRMRRQGDSFAVATVVRTLSVTAAKPGAKAIINNSGEVLEGWIGGGCARSAVVKAAIKSIADGEPRYLSIHPDEVLKEKELNVGEEVDGVWVASNFCPSKGSMELFIEPYLANPELIIVGTTPVASSLSELAPVFDFNVSTFGGSQNEALGTTDGCYQHWHDVSVNHAHRYIVVATQGAGDMKALTGALAVQARHIGFVGSHRKMAHLKNALQSQLHDVTVLERIKGPAGLDIGGVTPQEIALSILAELVQIRRIKSRQSNLD